MLRVALVVRPAAGGIRRHVSSLLSRLNRSEFAPTLFAPADFPLDAAVPQPYHVALPIASGTSPIRDLRAILTLSRRLRGAFDVVHAHGLRGALIGVPAARLARIPALFTAHNLVPPSGRVTRAVVQYLGRNASIIAVSRAVARTLESCGVDPDRIRVVPNGVDPALFDTGALDELTRRQLLAEYVARPGNHRLDCVTAAWLRNPLNLDKPLFVVAGIGRLSREKGFDVLISALRLAQMADDDTPPLAGPHILAGSGPEEARLRTMAQETPNVVLIGSVADVAPLLKAVDIIVIPSREEGQGLVALEAMAARKPVIATSVGGLVETVIDGETGILVPPNDPRALAAALRTLALEPEKRKRMGEKGRERVEQNYVLQQMIDRIAAIYRLTAGMNNSSVQ